MWSSWGQLLNDILAGLPAALAAPNTPAPPAMLLAFERWLLLLKVGGKGGGCCLCAGCVAVCGGGKCCVHYHVVLLWRVSTKSRHTWHAVLGVPTSAS